MQSDDGMHLYVHEVKVSCDCSSLESSLSIEKNCATDIFSTWGVYKSSWIPVTSVLTLDVFQQHEMYLT